ncbi:DUF4347 domain-containing protein [Flagellimonas sediminis]|uniref:DUF4347 domain-containing protein n=1 Tax=Flagellimonas sediminis TaxID=2696468 RepID=A0A6I5L520_9FLAO|nr:DUF4347 domain-containing protein [Allomuricauda sediminis]NDV44791.1 DUF4347 domain-containing protein [Allomuricauda sediminis]
MKNQVNRKSSIFFLMLIILFVTRSMAQSNELVVIDSNYSQKQQVLDHLASGIPVFEVNAPKNPWESIRQYLEQSRSTQVVHLFANANYNAMELGGKTYDADAVDQEFELSMLEGLFQGIHIQLLIYDCNLGSNPEGLALLKKISDKAYLNIAVPTNCSSIFGADLDFDHTTMNQPVNNSIFK